MSLDPGIIAPPTETNIRVAGEELRQGRLVVIPTETVYGLAALALDPLAVSRIFETKKRPSFDPLICHISNIGMLDSIARNVPSAVTSLIDAFWPGPLTLILEKNPHVPDIVTSGLETVAVRMPAHPVCRRLIDTINAPLAAPSANMFGRLSPTRPEHCLNLDGDIRIILNGGPSQIGVESTIVRYYREKLYILRPGGITEEALHEVSGLAPLRIDEARLPEAPGQLSSHYAPHAPVVIINPGDPFPSDCEKSCFLGFQSYRDETCLSQEVLAPNGDLHTAAARLFEMLHTLDAKSPRSIIVEAVPERGLGIAIMNRLKKSAAPRPTEDTIQE